MDTLKVTRVFSDGNVYVRREVVELPFAEAVLELARRPATLAPFVEAGDYCSRLASDLNGAEWRSLNLVTRTVAEAGAVDLVIDDVTAEQLAPSVRAAVVGANGLPSADVLEDIADMHAQALSGIPAF